MYKPTFFTGDSLLIKVQKGKFLLLHLKAVA